MPTEPLRSRWAATRASMPLDFIMELREINVTPHVAQNTTRRSAIDRAARTRHPGYDISQRVRKRIEEGFGWMKTIGGMRKPKYRSREKGRLVIHLCSRRLQPDPPAKAHGPTGMSATRTPIPIPIAPFKLKISEQHENRLLLQQPARGRSASPNSQRRSTRT